MIQQKLKKDVYREIIKNLIKTNSISKSTRGLMSEKGGRLFVSRLEDNGFINFKYKRNNQKVVTLTEKGQQLFKNLNDFSFVFKEKELFK